MIDTLPYLIPPHLIGQKAQFKANVTFKPSLRADAEEHGPLFFTASGTSDMSVRMDARAQLKRHLRDNKHPLASTSYWFMSSMNVVEEE